MKVPEPEPSTGGSSLGHLVEDVKKAPNSLQVKSLGGKRASVMSQKSSRGGSIVSKSPTNKSKKMMIDEFRKFSVKIEKKTCQLDTGPK
jgi:hypothetical protein